MEDTDFDWLCNGLPADEAKCMRKIFVEWCDGDENGFPVQLALLTQAQWRAAALVPQAVNNSRKLIERHLAEYRQQTAVLVKNLSIVAEGQAGELKNIVEAHTETVNQASVSIRNQLWEMAEAAKRSGKNWTTAFQHGTAPEPTWKPEANDFKNPARNWMTGSPCAN